MDIDKPFVQAVLANGEKALVLATERGIDGERHLAGEGQNAWNFVMQYKREYGSLPSAAVVSAATGIDLGSAPDEPVEFWIAELRKRRIYSICHSGFTDANRQLEKLDPQAAAEIVAEIHRKLQEENLTLSKVESLLALGKQVIKLYDDAKAGIRGIPAPWQTMDEQMMGWSPEDLILFVGRLGTGKTWMLLIICHAAWKANKRVLIASTEMAKVKLAQRFFALTLRLPYEQVRKGRLGDFVEKKFKDGVIELVQNHGLYVVGGDFDFTIDSLDAAVDEAKAELVAVDGAYLIKSQGKDRHERVSNTFDDLKRIAKKRKLSLIANTQFNRSAKAGQESTIAAENIGITDVAGWNADGIYGLLQSDEMRIDKVMGIKSLKVREGRPSDFRCRWDLDSMDFSEVDENGKVLKRSVGDAYVRNDGVEKKETPEREPGSDDLEDLPF